MTYKEIAEKLDMNKAMEDEWFGEELCYDLDETPNIAYFPQNGDKLRCFLIFPVYDTDSLVGIRMYFLDNEPVAAGFKSGRKSDIHIAWFSKAAKIKTKRYIHSIIEELDESTDYSNYISINDSIEISRTRKIDYISEVYSIMWNYATYKGHKFELTKGTDYRNYEKNRYIDIILDTGESIIVDIRDIDFDYPIN